MKRLITFAACAALLTACSPQKPAPTAAAGVKFNTDALEMPEFMGHVVDPASFAYWKGSGTEVTAKGEKDLTPTTDEGWEQMETAAAVLIEAGNGLQLPGRARAPGRPTATTSSPSSSPPRRSWPRPRPRSTTRPASMAKAPRSI